MKLKILKKFPKKITGNIDERTYAISTAGGNAMIDQIGEIEVELDRDKIIDVIEKHCRKVKINSTDWVRVQVAKAIVDNFKEIIKSD